MESKFMREVYELEQQSLCGFKCKKNVNSKLLLHIFVIGIHIIIEGKDK